MGFAAQLHVALAIHNYGIHEYMQHLDATNTIFEQSMSFKDGYLHPGNKPGLGVEFNEEAANPTVLRQATALHRAIVLGVSGCGKPTVGEPLGGMLGTQFLGGDSLHPQANNDKMAAGHPLDDTDREPWLRKVGQRLGRRRIGAHCRLGVETQLPRFDPCPCAGYFKPVGLLESQLATLEPVGEDEAAVVLDIAATPEQLASQAAAWLEKCG